MFIQEFPLWCNGIPRVSGLCCTTQVLSPAWHSGLKDPALPQLRGRLQLIPGPGTPYATERPKKKKIKNCMYLVKDYITLHPQSDVLVKIYRVPALLGKRPCLQRVYILVRRDRININK